VTVGGRWIVVALASMALPGCADSAESDRAVSTTTTPVPPPTGSVPVEGAPRPLDLVAVAGPWTDVDGDIVVDNRALDDGQQLVLALVDVGPSHCEWETAHMMAIAMPIGEPTPFEPERVYQYNRDPAGAISPEQQSRLDLDATLPDGAEFSGLSAGDVELWVDPAHVEDHIFLTNGETVERWPRADPPFICR
jgi:hypothetical protein